MSGKGYVGNGNGPWNSYNDFWEFVPGPGVLGGTWTSKPNFPSNHRGAAYGFSIGTKGYMGGGEDFMNDFWEYDPAKETDSLGPWTQKASVPVGRTNAVGFSIGSTGFVGLNGDPNNPNHCGAPNDFWEYVPERNKWIRRQDFWGSTARPRQAAIAFSIGGKGYVGMGSDGVGDDLWEYIPYVMTDADKDGLDGGKEMIYGTDPNSFDTNGDGLADAVNVAVGLNPLNSDTDGDGISNAQEVLNGTNPIHADTDGDGVSDSLDAFPNDHLRTQLPAPNPSDHTPPVITLQEPQL